LSALKGAEAKISNLLDQLTRRDALPILCVVAYANKDKWSEETKNEKETSMRIAVDAMGGDFGPRVTVEGAFRASKDYNLEVLLVGVEDLIKKEFNKRHGNKGKVTIIDAPEPIGMGEGIFSFRKKKRSSILVGTKLVKEKSADAFVSMGNTAAVVFISKRVLGALNGVDRPALALLVPTLKGITLLIDVGANANCLPHNLEQFATMGRIFMESVLGLRNPRVGLMSIGEERTKGNDLTKETFERIQASSMNFIGNVEGKDIFSGKADVIVSDGFTGNVALKACEGMVETLFSLVRREIMKNMLARIGFFLMNRNMKKIYKKLDYSEYGGAHLLGIDGICIIGHGRSDPNAVKNAVRVAKELVTKKVKERIQQSLSRAKPGLNGI
jgi:glycerol-3-phosphate acyltransferase PlsX